MSMKYYPMDLAYDDKTTGIYIQKKSAFPFMTYWRNNPLSDKSYIRPNVAGYYPQPVYSITKRIKRDEDWQFSYTNVCSTIVPDNPQYVKTKEIILYR
jgi:hypothetical protein